MKFFPPRRPDRDEAEQAYEQLVKRAGTEAGQPIKPERKAGRQSAMVAMPAGGSISSSGLPMRSRTQAK